jgi:signal transduction histidine kinase
MMAQLYRDIYNIEKAIEYGEKSVALNNKDPFAYLALGLAYATAHNYEKANIYYEKALLLNETNYNDYLQGLLYYFIASSAFSSYDINKAEKYIHLALEINRPFGPPNYYSDLILLSKVEQVKGNSKEAEKHAKEALQIAIELETLEEQKYCYSILSELAIAKGNHLESIKYWEECDLVEIAIATNLTLHATEEMAVKYETAKKEFEIEQQKTIITNQNLQRIFLASGIVVCILMLVLLLFLLRLRTRRNSELAEMNLTKDKFFNIISHDLKNPAVAQRNALQVLVKNARTWNTDTLTDYYDELLKSAEGQVELLLNLLNWSQLQTGRIAYNPETFAMSELSTNFSLIRNMAENKGIAFNIQMPVNAIITCDSKMLITIIRNLLVNAVKFTATGGRVTLDISPCNDGRDVASNVSTKYTVSISDTGVGMSELHLNTLFHLESAHSHPGTAGEQGTGLGLIICKELVEKLGSKLHVDSVEGVGSKFWFNV